LSASHFDTPVLEGGAGTGRCLINVTPDGQRTMCTFLGAANQLGVEDIDADLIGSSAIVYLEGYLFDPAPARAAPGRLTAPRLASPGPRPAPPRPAACGVAVRPARSGCARRLRPAGPRGAGAGGRCARPRWASVGAGRMRRG
jgi:hypothetical protein